MWTALKLKKRRPGLKVLLLEATKLGDGASSCNEASYRAIGSRYRWILRLSLLD
ncbi:hypothetical protein F7661_20120 [Pseudomonas sp. CFA]|nr:hypothetical protein F7661_20120 [Pseudomonas sp. CFA]